MGTGVEGRGHLPWSSFSIRNEMGVEERQIPAISFGGGTSDWWVAFGRSREIWGHGPPTFSRSRSLGMMALGERGTLPLGEGCPSLISRVLKMRSTCRDPFLIASPP